MSKKAALRMFFATDIHGSDRCFKKFLAAARVYEADVLVLGGDVAGKAIVPITRRSGGEYSFQLFDTEHSIDEGALEAAKASIGINGFYPCVMDPDAIKQLGEDGRFRERLFQTLIGQQMRSWASLVGERLQGRTRCIVTPGNDDPYVVDEVFASVPGVEFTEGQVIQVGPIWLASLGNTNRTPWHTEREYDEPVLANQIDELVNDYADGRSLVFNFHCPPFGSGLDTVMQLDEQLKPVIRNGSPVLIPVGSTAVREAIRKYQPVVALHGHIHESQGVFMLGKTKCLNPGSDYSGGVLKGVIVDFGRDGRLLHHLFTTG